MNQKLMETFSPKILDFSGQYVGNDDDFRYKLKSRDWETLCSQNEPFSLVLSCSTVTDRELKRLCDSPFLISLNLAKTNITDEGLALLGTLPALKELILDETNITDSAIDSLLSWRQIVNLSLLDCRRISSKGLARLVHLTDLECLELSGTLLDDSSLISLAQLKKLKTVMFCNVDITDTGLAALAQIDSLEKIYLGHCRLITDKGLAEFTRLPHLKFLNYDHSPLTTRKGKRLLRRLLKHTQIFDGRMEWWQYILVPAIVPAILLIGAFALGFESLIILFHKITRMFKR